MIDVNVSEHHTFAGAIKRQFPTQIITARMVGGVHSCLSHGGLYLMKPTTHLALCPEWSRDVVLLTC